MSHRPLWPRIRLYLIRHGESQMNTNMHLLGGQHNHVGLTAKGTAQSQLLGQRLAFDKIRFDGVYTSTAVRAINTAAIALHSSGHSNGDDDGAIPVASAALLEQGQGDWEGKHRSEVYTPQAYKDMLEQLMDFRAPGGESLKDVQRRALGFLEKEIEKWKLVSTSSEREIVLGVFSHGGCIRTLLQSLVGFHEKWTWMVAQENTAVNELHWDAKGWSTLRINDSAHLRYSMSPPRAPPALPQDVQDQLEATEKAAATLPLQQAAASTRVRALEEQENSVVVPASASATASSPAASAAGPQASPASSPTAVATPEPAPQPAPVAITGYPGLTKAQPIVAQPPNPALVGGQPIKLSNAAAPRRSAFD